MSKAPPSNGALCGADDGVAVQGFAGVDYSTKDRSSGPVQFERDPAEAVEADPFGLDQIISEVRCLPPLWTQLCAQGCHACKLPCLGAWRDPDEPQCVPIQGMYAWSTAQSYC